MTLVFSVADPAGSVLAELSIRAVPESSCRRGAILRGSARHGCVRAEVEIDVEEGRYRIEVRTRWESFLPQDSLPVARFLAAYRAPNSVSVARDDGRMRGTPEPCPPDPLLPGELAEFVESLALIQITTGIVRDVTAEIGLPDLAEFAVGRALLAGAIVRRPWTSLVMRLVPEALLGQIDRLAVARCVDRRVARVAEEPADPEVVLPAASSRNTRSNASAVSRAPRPRPR